MFCPQCGYRSTSEHARFCQGCGFRMDGVTDLLASGGALMAREPEGTGTKSRRLPVYRKRIRQGAKVMFLSAVLFPLFLGLSIAVDGPGPLLVPFTVFLAGIAWSLYNLIFGEDAPAPEPRLVAAPPTPRSIGPRPFDTGEIVQPPSVTEHTTKLFEERNDQPQRAQRYTE